jgi:CRISPR/Cas system-associated exonuclease Cas4 (RecB family)
MILSENFDFTQSNLQDYVDCPYRFYLRYIKHTKWLALMVDDAHDFEKRTQAGARFHRLVQQYFSGVPEERINQFVNADPLPELAIWWDNFLSDIPSKLLGVQLVERVLSTHLTGYRLLAKYDMILIMDQKGLIIFDWKTSSKKPHKQRLLQKIQTRLYRYILVQAGAALKIDDIVPSQVTMTYWFASFPQTPISLPYDQESFEKDEVFFTRLIEEIRDNKESDFSRTSDTRKCRYCVYRSHCDRGVKAGDLGSFEDFDLAGEQDELDIDFENIQEIEF